MSPHGIMLILKFSCQLKQFAGDVILKVPPELATCVVDLCASSISIDNQLNQHDLKHCENGGRVHLTGVCVCVCVCVWTVSSSCSHVDFNYEWCLNLH